MSYKDILVFLDGSSDNEARLDFALSLAASYGARLTGVDVNSEAAFDGEWFERATGLGDLFDTKARQVGVNSRLKIADRKTASWKDLYAHYADLLVATQPSAEASGRILPLVPEDVLISAGVPMVVLPHGWKSGSADQNIVIAWSPSSQATRAVHDAMPILQRARKVTVFAFDPPSDAKDEDVKLLFDHLLAHGVRAEADRWPDTGELSEIEALFASRGMEDADLVVAGAYSHSRFRETLFGGMTRELLQQFSVPVFISH